MNVLTICQICCTKLYFGPKWPTLHFIWPIFTHQGAPSGFHGYTFKSESSSITKTILSFHCYFWLFARSTYRMWWSPPLSIEEIKTMTYEMILNLPIPNSKKQIIEMPSPDPRVSRGLISTHNTETFHALNIENANPKSQPMTRKHSTALNIENANPKSQPITRKHSTAWTLRTPIPNLNPFINPGYHQINLTNLDRIP